MLKGVHFLLTYKCDLECDHCFVWGTSQAKGTFTLKQIENVLAEAKKLGTVTYISFEGGEPFLFYPIMIKGVEKATKLGFHVEVLSNCYWASDAEDAKQWLLPIAKAGDVELTLSSDLYHGDSWETELVRNAVKAANALNIKTSILAVRFPDAEKPCPSEIEGAKVGLWDLMFKGRASEKLTEKASKKPWHEFTKCPYEKFETQERVHIDPFGYVHVCQGISIGNVWQQPFSEIIKEYSPSTNPILEPLVSGGPATLVKRFNVPHENEYADACHLCFNARCVLRERFPQILVPDQMYGKRE